MTGPEAQRALIDRLVADAAPVHRLWSPGARLGLWALLFAVMLAVMCGAIGWPLGGTARAAWLAWELACAAAAALLWAALALHAAVPGFGTPRWAPIGATVLALLPIAFWLDRPASQAEWPLHAFIQRGLPCAEHTVALAILPSLVLLWAVHRGAPLAPRRAAAWAGGAAFLSSYVLMRVFCPADDPAHLLIWHVAPMVAGIAVCAAAGSWWLARWRRSTRTA